MSFKADQQRIASNPSMSGPDRLVGYMQIYQSVDEQIADKVKQDQMEQVEHSAAAKAKTGPDTGGAAKTASTRKVRYNENNRPV